jgi:hypothetical protein
MTTDHPVVAFSRAVLGFSLYPGQAEIIAEIYRDRIRQAILRLGRRSGKGRIAAVVAVYEATVNAAVHVAAVPSGEQVAVVIVATSQAQARIIHRFIRAFLKVDALAGLVVRDSIDEIELSNGIVIVTMPCTARSTRGLAVAVLILDEAAWMLDTTGSPIAAEEVWQALAPAVAQFPEGKILITSTPRFSAGWFFDVVELATRGSFPDIRHWHRTTAEMNPRIPASFLEAERAKDPVAFRREYEAEFESALAAAFDHELVQAAVRDRPDLPARPNVTYLVAVDAAFTGDTFSALVGHREPGDSVVIDRVTGWRGSKANPVRIDPTLDAVAALAAAFNGASVVIDQYSAEPIKQGLRVRGVTVRERPWTNESKVDAVAAVRRVLYAGHLEIPRHRQLVEELVTLEQRPTPGGRPRFAAPGRQHDDFATALMALVRELTKVRRVPYLDVSPEGRIVCTYREVVNQ